MYLVASASPGSNRLPNINALLIANVLPAISVCFLPVRLLGVDRVYVFSITHIADAGFCPRSPFSVV